MAENFTENVEDLRERTQQLASQVAVVLADVKGSSAVAAIVHRAVEAAGDTELAFQHACRVKSKETFYERLPQVAASADEVTYWLGLAARTGLIDQAKIKPLHRQASDAAASLKAIVLKQSRNSR